MFDTFLWLCSNVLFIDIELQIVWINSRATQNPAIPNHFISVSLYHDRVENRDICLMLDLGFPSLISIPIACHL